MPILDFRTSGDVRGANNGLTETGAHIVQLGGTLIQNTTVTQAGFTLTFSDAASGMSIVNGAVTIPTIGATTTAALINNNTPDYFITTPGQILWIDQVGGVQSSVASVSSAGADIGMQVTATQRNQFFCNATSSELEIGDNTYGTTVSLAAASLKNPGAGVYQALILVRDNYTSAQDYDTNSIDVTQTDIIFSILTPTVAGVDGTPLNQMSLDATDLIISAYLNTRDDTGTTAPINFIYTDATGTFLSAPVGGAFGFWSLTGNAGIDPLTNFFGTIDNQPILFQVNSTAWGRLDFSGNIGFGNISLANITTGSNNVCLGAQAGGNIVDGIKNVAIGFQARPAGVNTTNSIAIGSDAIAGNDGIALGNTITAVAGEFAISTTITQLNFELNGQSAGYVLTTDGAAATWQPQSARSGTDTPTLTNTTNITSSSVNVDTLYTMVTDPVSGEVIVTAQYSIVVNATAAAAAELRVTLPQTANPSAHLSGQGEYANNGAPVPAHVIPVDGTHCAIHFVPTATGANYLLQFSITFRAN